MRRLISLTTLFICLNSFAQNEYDYTIDGVKNDNIYYNFLYINNKAYIGSDKGIFLFDKNELELIDNQKKGYITISNGTITSDILSNNFEFFNTKFNHLLPKNYQIKHTTYLKIDNQLLIISKGALFIFKKLNYGISYDSLSIRSISKNIVGSYSGIYINNKKIPYPDYTDGTVKEFGNEKFICYGGLLQIKDGKTINYKSDGKLEFEIFNRKLGLIRDIFQISKQLYVAVTTQGLFKINFIDESVETIRIHEETDEYSNIFHIENQTNIFYFFKNKIYNYSLTEKKDSLIFETESKDLIKDIFFKDRRNFYILFNNALIHYKANSSFVFSENLVWNDLKNCHNLVLYNDYLCVSSDYGLHFIDIFNNKKYLNIICLEANRRSLIVINDTLKVGTTNGIISISVREFDLLLKNFDRLHEEKSKISPNKIIFLICLLIIIFLTILLLKKNTQKITENYSSDQPILTKENIIKYINSNINIVSIKSICDNFNIDRVKLYELFEHEKPGEIIRNLRLSLVRKYRREKKDDKFISENTGFSESYLKKIY